jgi:hypothetical protein
MEGYPDNNPKSIFGVKKPPLALIPSSALVHCARAFKDGAIKYGPYNWRDKDVSAMVYLNAAERHIRQYLDGERKDIKSLVHHLGHAMACCAIILDAETCGVLIDDRPKALDLTKLLEEETDE